MELQDVIEKDLCLHPRDWSKDFDLVREIQLCLLSAELLQIKDITSNLDPTTEKALGRFLDLAHLDPKYILVLEPKLASALLAVENRWMRSPKVEYPFKLQVPIFPQNDNAIASLRANALLAIYLKPDLVSSEKDYYEKFVKNKFAPTDQIGHTHVLKRDLQIDNTWRYDLGYEDLDFQLNRKIPFLIEILIHGGTEYPRGAQSMVVIGKNSPDEYICVDPRRGSEVIYKKRDLDHRWLVKERPDTGWGRLIF